MTRTFRSLRPASLVAAAAAILFAGVPASAQGTDWSGWEGCAELRLPADKNSVEVTSHLADHIREQNPLTGEEVFFGDQLGDSQMYRVMAECVLIAGPGTIELTISLTADDPWVQGLLSDGRSPLLQLALFENAASPSVDPFTHLPVGTQYRELLLNPDPEGRRIEVILDGRRHRGLMDQGSLRSGDLDRIYRATKIVWTLRRLERGPCFMGATVSGDLSGRHLGDIAYFNVFEEGVATGTAAGTFLDPSAHQALDGLSDFGTWLDGFLTDEDEGKEKGAADGKEKQEPPKTELRKYFESGWDLSGSDNFGLTLVGGLLDVEAPVGTDGDPNSDLIGSVQRGDPRATAGLLGAMKVLGSTFTLGVSGRSAFIEKDPQFKFGDHFVKFGEHYVVEASTVVATPGAMDANVSAVKFLWVPGQGEKPEIRFREVGPGVIVGFLGGWLLSERQYDGRRLNIRVEAEFIALQGAVSCQ